MHVKTDLLQAQNRSVYIQDHNLAIHRVEMTRAEATRMEATRMEATQVSLRLPVLQQSDFGSSKKVFSIEGKALTLEQQAKT